MTDQENPQQEASEEVMPPPHPLYAAAETDYFIRINFIGNTPVVYGYEGFGVTPYHMLAASEDMKRKAFQMIQAAEIAEADARKKVAAQNEILTTENLPPGRFKVGG